MKDYLYHFEPVTNVIMYYPTQTPELNLVSHAWEFLNGWFFSEEIGLHRKSNEDSGGYTNEESRGYTNHNCQYWRNWHMNEDFLKKEIRRFYELNNPFEECLIQTDLKVLEYYEWNVELTLTHYNLNNDRVDSASFTIHHKKGQKLSELHTKFSETNVERNLDFFTATELFGHFSSLDECIDAYGGYDNDERVLDKGDIEIFKRTVSVMESYWKQYYGDVVDDKWIWEHYETKCPNFVVQAKKAMKR